VGHYGGRMIRYGTFIFKIFQNIFCVNILSLNDRAKRLPNSDCVLFSGSAVFSYRIVFVSDLLL